MSRIKNILNKDIGTLVLLRIVLPIFIVKALVQKLNIIYAFPNRANYELSLTYLNQHLPLDFLALNSSNYYIIKYSIVVIACLCIIGFLGRFNLFVLGFLSLYIGGSYEGIGIFSHELAMVSQVILLLAFLPGTLNLSIDQLIFKSLKFRRAKTTEIKFGIRLILLMVTLIYLTAGISKIRFGGFEWLNGSTLKYYLTHTTNDFEIGDRQLFIKSNSHSNWRGDFTFEAYTYGTSRTNKSIISIANYIANHQFLISLFSVLSVLIELLGFVMFINSKWRNFYLTSIIMMHVAIYILMGINFIGFQLLALCLIDWKQLVTFLSQTFFKNKEISNYI